MSVSAPKLEDWPPLSQSEVDTFRRYERARERIDEGLIRPELSSKEPERSEAKWKARMAEMRSFLAECGDPQRAFKAVHVTGTSGKGSVCVILAEALRRAGYKVGLHVSPFLQSPTEKIWIDGKLVGGDEFADLVDWVWPMALPRKTLDNPASIHGMASVVIAFEAFRRAEVDVAVVEAGCGGRFDLTNVLDPVATVITSVGLDHVQSLGPEVTDIAWHKAGIMRQGVPAVTGARGAPLDVIRREAESLGAPLEEVDVGSGPFWEQNATLAEAACRALETSLPASPHEIEAAAGSVRLPARREVIFEEGRTIILDGAHNPDKMAALTATLEAGSTVVLGCLQAKKLGGIVSAIAPVAGRVVATEPTVYAKPATSAEEVGEACRDLGLETLVEPDPQAALELALGEGPKDRPVVVTGSLYLVGQVRERWFPVARVVLQGTSWPRP